MDVGPNQLREWLRSTQGCPVQVVAEFLLAKNIVDHEKGSLTVMLLQLRGFLRHGVVKSNCRFGRNSA